MGRVREFRYPQRREALRRGRAPRTWTWGFLGWVRTCRLQIEIYVLERRIRIKEVITYYVPATVP